MLKNVSISYKICNIHQAFKHTTLLINGLKNLSFNFYMEFFLENCVCYIRSGTSIPKSLNPDEII